MISVSARVGLLVCVAVSQVMAQPFQDSFENDFFAPFWTVTQQIGTVTLGNIPHTGSHSVQYTAVTGGQRNLSLSHTFNTPLKGQFSVWMFDSYAGIEGLYFKLELQNTSTGNVMSVGIQDFCATAYSAEVDGQGAGGPCANPSPTISNIQRKKGWHFVCIRVLPTSVEISIDGALAYQKSGNYTVNFVKLYLAGPVWRPSVNPMIDDFEFRPL